MTAADSTKRRVMKMAMAGRRLDRRNPTHHFVASNITASALSSQGQTLKPGGDYLA